jgi:putative membrane protein
MDYMFASGFLGTPAPFFMDFVMLIVAVLPFLIGLGIVLARQGWYGTHRVYQWFVFVVSVIVVGWFEYGVRVGGGFRSFVETSTLPKSLLWGVLIFHILVSIWTIVWWIRTLIAAERAYEKRNLPGGHTLLHRPQGWQTAVGVLLTSLSGIGVYLTVIQL